jgi:DNA anti-recombination protein RmuC
MNNETQTAEMELPQIRQMVLENTRRINRNEQLINEMRKKEIEKAQERRERETYWDVAREEHDRAHREHERDMEKIREFMYNHAVQFDEDLKKSREKFDEDLKKSREKFDEDLKKSSEKLEADLKKSREEFNQRQAELDAKADERHRKFDEDLKKSRKEFDNRMKTLDETITQLTKDFIGSIGHIVEGLAGTKVEEMFMEQGYEISDKKRNVHRKIKILNKEMEADVVLLGENLAIVIEVKTNCTRKNVDEFVDHMKNRFRELFPEWSNLEILGAVAAINYDNDADAYAHQNGLLVIRTDTRNVFSLDKSDRETLCRF